MPAVAKAALVSEATAYRYFPDLVSLLREAVDGTWPSPGGGARAGRRTCTIRSSGSRSPTEHLLRHVQRYQGAVRAMISASIVRPGSAAMRPGLPIRPHRHALAPLDATLGQRGRRRCGSSSRISPS